LRREGWQTYLDSSSGAGLAYGYDQKETTLLKLMEQAPARGKKKQQEEKETPTLAQPILMQGETIGKLMLTEPGSLADDAADIMTAVAERLSAHIENLRLSEQTEQARQQAELLFQGSAAINTAQSYAEVLAALRENSLIGHISVNNISLNYFDSPWESDRKPDWIEVLTRWSRLPAEVLSSRYATADFASIDMLLRPDAPTIIEDVATDRRMDKNLRTLYQDRFQAKSTLFIPLVVGSQWMGYINAIYADKMHFPEDDIRRLITLAQQAAVAIQSIRLFAQAQARVERERQVRTITDKIRRGTDRENILRIAREELAQMLGASKTVARLGADVQRLAHPGQAAEVKADGERRGSHTAASGRDLEIEKETSRAIAHHDE
jgi:GAF domain-containing protein